MGKHNVAHHSEIRKLFSEKNCCVICGFDLPASKELRYSINRSTAQLFRPKLYLLLMKLRIGVLYCYLADIAVFERKQPEKPRIKSMNRELLFMRGFNRNFLSNTMPALSSNTEKLTFLIVETLKRRSGNRRCIFC